MSSVNLNNSFDLSLTTLQEDDSNPTGIQISDLFSTGNLTDELGITITSGIAITSINTTLVNWQYKLSSSDIWQEINPNDIGDNSSSGLVGCLLLGPNSQLRAVPLTNKNGSIINGLTFKAWLQQNYENEGNYSSISIVDNNYLSQEQEELSVTINPVNDAPSFEHIRANTNSFTENSRTPILLADNVQIIDAELLSLDDGNGNYNGARFTLMREGGARTEDVFFARNDLLISDSNVLSINDVIIGSISNQNGILSILFNENSTQNIVNQTLSSIGYINTSNAPDSSLSFVWALDDANNAGTQGEGGSLTGTITSSISVIKINDAPDLSLGNDTSQSYIEGADPVVIAPSARIFDSELSAINNVGNYNGSRLTISRTDNPHTEDIFSATGNLSFSGNNLVLGGIIIGRVSNNSGLLTILFNNNATQSRVNQSINKIAYSNSSNNPINEVSLTWRFSDANAGAQGTGGTLTSTASSLIQITDTDDEGRVLVSGGTALGDTLRADVTDPDGLPRNVRYQWMADNTLIEGASGGTLLLTASMLRQTISVQAIYDDPFGSHTVISESTAPVGGRRLTAGDDDYTGTSVIDWVLALGGNDYLRGYGSADSLDGGDGDDTIDGGIGADHMLGGAGNDVYYVDNTDDEVVESSTENGTDLVYSTATYTIGSFIENLILIGSSAVNATGNSLNNYIKGNSAVNIINGGNGNDTLDGGAGLDVLFGGNGNDTYYVDNIGDTIIEESSSGIDTIYSNHSRALGSNQENLILTDRSIIGTGNSLDNYITGNSLANSLVGGNGNDTLDGSSGADTLEGGMGDDNYYIDNSRDITKEIDANSGTDTIYSTVSWQLGNFIENLTLLGNLSIDATGNSLDNILIGNNSANKLNGGRGADTMNGGAGNDTYFIDNVRDVIIEGSARGGNDTLISAFSKTLTGSLKYIENITLTGSARNATGNSSDNILIGNSLNNSLNGGDGNDTLDGGVGLDTMNGGSGDDTYYTNATGDLIIEHTEGGNDTLISSVSRTLDANIENLILDGTSLINATGNSEDNFLQGNSASNLLKGMNGNDTLDGGAGVDTLIGGAGNDVYYVDNINDYVVETRARDGIDTVISSVTRFLGDFQENLVLSGSTAINGTGNSLNNKITGNDAANALNGQAGADTMRGGNGNDIYYVENIGDRVIEDNVDGGIDTVMSSINYTLGSNIENLILTPGALRANGNILNNSIAGNSSDNRITGNDGADTLDGGAGNDTLIGGNGNDTYIVDSFRDVISETLETGGEDTVKSSVTWTLGINLENLTLIGAQAINGIGNILNNKITGNSGANILNGGAGNDTLDGENGADTLNGGDGDDIYIIDTSFDVIKELNITGGLDTVNSFVTWTLGKNLENLSLLGSQEINGTGNTLDNIIAGNRSANLILGRAGNDTLVGGAGQDTLTGGSGADVFVLTSSDESSPSKTTWDIITDFNSGEDKLDLSAIDANINRNGDQAFASLISRTSNFTTAGQLKFYNGILYGNTDSDTAAEFAISFTGITDFSLTDIIL